MGLMITDDGVDDDSDAVSDNNDYNDIGACHCGDTPCPSEPQNHSAFSSRCT